MPEAVGTIDAERIEALANLHIYGKFIVHLINLSVQKCYALINFPHNLINLLLGFGEILPFTGKRT